MECHTEFMNKQMHSSEQSTTSTDNTEDILILGANESHYAEAKYHHHHRFVDQAAVETSFTVLSAPPLAANDSMGDIDLSRMQMTRDHLERISSDEIDESTEVLLVIRSEEKTPHTKSGGVSGTDSDVEVLMSEEIVDSDWSAGAGDELEQKDEDNCEALEDFVDNPNVRSIKTNRSESISGNSSLKQVVGSPSCTDHDVLSGEEFSSAASLMGAYDKLTHSELVTILCDQAERIEQLETQLSRYRSVQQAFFDNVAELKLQLDDVTKEYSRKN